MQVIESIVELRKARALLKGPVGLVPTMGYLHAGHLSLVAEARRDNTAVIATIFVNPAQFAANEDLSTYPRDLPRDLSMLENAGADLVFTPPPAEIYPPAYQTYVTVEGVSQGGEGAVRPHFFRGVATVVAKLFNLIQPDFAYFGQKDAQQVVVIRRMAADLNFLLQIVVCPILREADGLAMSSRNVYLTPEERKAAAVLYRGLQAAAFAYDAGERDAAKLRESAEMIIRQEPLAHLNYVSLVRAHDLAELENPIVSPALLSVAAQVGHTRLIDNCLLPSALNTREGATQILGAV